MTYPDLRNISPLSFSNRTKSWRRDRFFNALEICNHGVVASFSLDATKVYKSKD